MYRFVKVFTINNLIVTPRFLLGVSFYPARTRRIPSVPVMWCPVAWMVAPRRSSDTKVALWSAVMLTVSFSLWPTDRAASCCRSPPSSDGEGRDG